MPKIQFRPQDSLGTKSLERDKVKPKLDKEIKSKNESNFVLSALWSMKHGKNMSKP